MKKITVLAEFIAREDKVDESKKLLQGLCAPTRNEKGCINYDLHQDSTDPRHFFLYENWESQADLELHLKSPHLTHFFEVEKSLFSAPIKLRCATKID
jgi:quinol monooxygenase YgiN